MDQRQLVCDLEASKRHRTGDHVDDHDGNNTNNDEKDIVWDQLEDNLYAWIGYGQRS